MLKKHLCHNDFVCTPEGLLNKIVTQILCESIELKLFQKKMQDMLKNHLCHNDFVCPP